MSGKCSVQLIFGTAVFQERERLFPQGRGSLRELVYLARRRTRATRHRPSPTNLVTKCLLLLQCVIAPRAQLPWMRLFALRHAFVERANTYEVGRRPRCWASLGCARCWCHWAHLRRNKKAVCTQPIAFKGNAMGISFCACLSSRCPGTASNAPAGSAPTPTTR